MRPELQAHIDELLDEYHRKRADLKKLQETWNRRRPLSPRPTT